MVKYGYENTATKMNETNKQNLKAVFDDMCKYTTENVTEKKGRKKIKYLEVRITLKTYTEMAIELAKAIQARIYTDCFIRVYIGLI